MKLQQGQVWKCGDEYVRIVRLERLEVGYKSGSNLKFSDGKHQHTSKKDFCRLLKGATLVAPAAGKTVTAASGDGPNVPAAAGRRDRAEAADDRDAAVAPKVGDDSAHAENGEVHPPDQTPAPPANN
jgi:hypothetical protein